MITSRKHFGSFFILWLRLSRLRCREGPKGVAARLQLASEGLTGDTKWVTPSPQVGSISGCDGALSAPAPCNLHHCKIKSLANCTAVTFLCCFPRSWVSTHALRAAGCPGLSQGLGQPATVSPPRPQDGLPLLCPQSLQFTPAPRKEGREPGAVDCEVWPEAAPSPGSQTETSRRSAGPVPHPPHAQAPWGRRYQAPQGKNRNAGTNNGNNPNNLRPAALANRTIKGICF